MNPGPPPLPGHATEEVRALIETLHRTMQRLEDLTAGEVDTVTNRGGRTYLLRRSEDRLRHEEAARQAAILDALPANIALLDAQGLIVSVNEAWRRFAGENIPQGPGCGVGADYLEVCDRARGDDASEALAAAGGIRSVLAGAARSFSLEYACRSPAQQRWFLMTVAPLAGAPMPGAVVMHLDISESKQAEIRVKRLNRVYAMLSGINSLIVRVRGRNELFREACRIAVEDGRFLLAWIGIVDRATLELTPVASSGTTPNALALVNQRFSLREDAPLGNTLSARAIREKSAIACNDVQIDPAIVFKEEHARRGSRSMAVLPLLGPDEAVGVLVLYSGELGFFDEAELKLLVSLAGDIAFALDHIDKRERLDYLAYYDVLTGLANRTLFLERLAQYMRAAAKGGRGHGLALFLIDLERFRNVNDSLGRPAGDELLRQAARWLSRMAGDVTLVARLGTDHFAVVLPEVRQDGTVSKLVEKWMDALLMHPFPLDGAVLRVSAKVGIAIFPDDGADAEALLTKAEAALKMAKKKGDRYLFHTQAMSDKVTGALTLENQLRQAVDREEFVLHYQPKMNLASGKVTGVEALIRWNDPRTGLVPPDRFIPILEETGLILEVGRWALRQALDDYLRWRTAGLAAVGRVAVNVSPLQLRHRGFIADIEKLVGLDARAAAGLELEITESLIMEDVKHSIASLQALRDLGVTIAIDDFGTGFSSLSYLSRLPLDTLKIDRSFVTAMTDSPQGLSLVATIINLTHSLKLNVVAEGVETEEQARLLRLLGCDEMQGFLVSKPVSAGTLETRFLAPPHELGAAHDGLA